MSMKRALLAVVVGALVITAGCSGAGGGDSGAPNRVDGGDAAGEPTSMRQQEQADMASTEQGEVLDFRSRAIIKTGTVSLEVDDFDTARQTLTTDVEQRGGFVSDSSKRVHRVDNATYTTGVLVLRVPSDEFSGMMARVEAEGDVLNSETSSNDVTDQLIDIEARLENLRVQRDRLRGLYDRANDTSDVLRVQRELAEVQERIERLEAHQQSLERRVALSTIRVELAEPEPDREPEPADNWYEVSVLSAFVASMNGVVILLRAFVVGFAYALPYLVVLGSPVAGLAVAWRYRDRWYHRDR